MKILQKVLSEFHQIESALQAFQAMAPDLVLVFGSVDWLHRLAGPLALQCHGAVRLGCTTAGEISARGVTQDSAVLTGLTFDHIRLQASSSELNAMPDSMAAGAALAAPLAHADLRAVWVLGQGVGINGSAMIAGMVAELGPDVLISGGLAGDAGRFQQTHVLFDAGVYANRLACVGLYGAAVQISHGSFGGWEPFGPARKVTRCEHNVLFELDHEPALEVYKRYLGEHAKGLPASGLLFPLAMLGADHQELGLLRTILGVDEAQGSLILAGEIKADGYLRLMHASTQALIGGAETAALAVAPMSRHHAPGLALLVSCVGRKLVMGGRVEEEVEVVAEALGSDTTVAGFYSYGEISPFSHDLQCQLHNQTMTITYLAEAQ